MVGFNGIEKKLIKRVLTVCLQACVIGQILEPLTDETIHPASQNWSIPLFICRFKNRSCPVDPSIKIRTRPLPVISLLTQSGFCRSYPLTRSLAIRQGVPFLGCDSENDQNNDN